MSTPNTSANIIFPNKSFTKKFDTIAIKGKLAPYSLTHHSHIKDKDRQEAEDKGKILYLEVMVEIGLEDFKALNTWKEYDGLPIKGLKKVMKTVYETDENGETKKDSKGNWIAQTDDEGNPVKEFSHYQFKMKQKMLTPEGTIKPMKIKVKKGIEFDVTKQIPVGSEVIINGCIWDYSRSDGKGVSNSLYDLTILELAEEQERTQQVDALAGFGIDSSEFESVANEDPFGDNPEPQKAAPKKTESEAYQAPAVEDFDDSEIPF